MGRKETATEIKNDLITYFLFDRNFVCAAHEIALCEGIADIAGISDGRQLYEVEVKVDWADLKSELDAIKQVQEFNNGLFGTGQNDNNTLAKPKYKKHFLYLKGAAEFCKNQYKMYEKLGDGNIFIDSVILKTFAPHKFYFAVPENLREKAVLALEGTPYGVISGRGTYKKAIALHKEELPFSVYPMFLRRLSMINYYKEV